ncbi:type II toxin-antitoxin system VapB family antitoxin [Luteolibacter arcticus]|uniref:Type II toxin-antitoxin system VapB family antitoxin n=1 Tax=Luteolibacter arcticus TaxID=1581411 RepID=A0ABT3GIY8_9BACT|nr:type II toxin-antitoxin system VapB family antitoxin [Luteolibacter arcticus]MCW1923465.1 type II toxin-antitoxin system VapB family antitoxin [Luteolibacter arcticus]
MRLTIDIDEKVLDEVMKYTGETKKGPAVLKAATDFLRRGRINEFTRRVMAGEFDFPMTNEELESAPLEDHSADGADR